MNKTFLLVIGFVLMVLGLQGVIRLLVNGDTGLLIWLDLDISLLIAIYVIIALSGIYLLSVAQKRTA